MTCPAGKSSRLWIKTHNRHGKDVIHIKFNPSDCLACPSREHCTKAKLGARMLTLHPDQQRSLALQHARERRKTASFKDVYARRAGIEGTIATSEFTALICAGGITLGWRRQNFSMCLSPLHSIWFAWERSCWKRLVLRPVFLALRDSHQFSKRRLNGMKRAQEIRQQHL